MRQTISISLPEDVKAELDEAVETDRVSRSDMIRRALHDYLFERKLRLLRSRFLPQAQAQGIHTDEDVFERIS